MKRKTLPLTAKEQDPLVALLNVTGGKLRPFFWFGLVKRADADKVKSGKTALKVKPAQGCIAGDGPLRFETVGTTKLASPVSPKIQASQLRYLMKGYPRTTALFLQSKAAQDADTRERLRAECFAAYCVEAPALTGQLIKSPASLAEVLSVASAFKRGNRRTMDTLNVETLHLIANWPALSRLKPIDRLNAVRTAFGSKPFAPDPGGSYSEAAHKEAEQLRKLSNRLNLPAVRKRGRPRTPGI